MSKTQEVLTKMNVAAANLAAELASQTLQDIGEQAAAKFYGDYSPRKYGRSYGLYEATKPLIKKINGPGVAQGGITISADSMGNHYHQGTNIVFEWDFIGGEHGGYNTGTPVSFPSPMDSIEKNVNIGRNLIAAECKAEAESIVKKQFGAELEQAVIADLKSQGVK